MYFASYAHDPAALRVEYLTPHGNEGVLPTIHQRIGIDPNPLAPGVADDVRWLEACLWSEEPARIARLHALVEQMRTWPPAARLAGTALERIDEALAACSTGPTPVIFHSWVAAYFSAQEQVQWRAHVLGHVADGAAWVYLEHPDSVRGLTPPSDQRETRRSGGSQIVVAEPRHDPVPWGWAHPHGRWGHPHATPRNVARS